MNSQCHTEFMVFSDQVLAFFDEVSLQCKNFLCHLSAALCPNPEF